ncbi:MAG: chlorophyll a-b binding domain-containing protein, partial [Candidatus Fonsibacter sp.]
PSSDLKFADMPHGLAAISKVPMLGWAQIVLFAAFVELRFYPADPSREPGDDKNGGILGIPNGSALTDPEERKRRLNSELANGRLAMTAILALFFQNGTVGTTGPEMWLGARSLRAFETELG